MAAQEFKNIVVSKTWKEIVTGRLSKKNPYTMYFPSDRNSMFFNDKEVGSQIGENANLITVTSDAELQAFVKYGSLTDTATSLSPGLYLIQLLNADGDNLCSAVLQASVSGTEVVKLLSGNVSLSPAGNVVFTGGADNTLRSSVRASDGATVWEYVGKSLVQELTVIEEEDEVCDKLLQKLDELRTKPGKYLIHYKYKFYDDRYNDDYINVTCSYEAEENLYKQFVKGCVIWAAEEHMFVVSYKQNEYFRGLYVNTTNTGDIERHELYPLAIFVNTNGNLWNGYNEITYGNFTVEHFNLLWESKPKGLDTNFKISENNWAEYDFTYSLHYSEDHTYDIQYITIFESPHVDYDKLMRRLANIGLDDSGVIHKNKHNVEMYPIQV